MSELFTSIALEVLISGSWVDLTPDVLVDPAVKFSRGISGNGINERLADVGRMTFSLKNGASNSAGLAGYYSPGHANALSGWTVSLPVRLSFTYDSWTVYKWRGRIEADGIKVIPGTLDARRVDVSCQDFMGLAADHKLNLLTPMDDVPINVAVETILSSMAFQPVSREYENVQFAANFPYIFDVTGSETTAMGELQNIATGMSDNATTVGRGTIVMRGGLADGDSLYATHLPNDDKHLPQVTADVNNLLLETGDALLLETGDNLLLEGDQDASFTDDDILPGSQFSYGKDIVNRVTIVAYPRRVDAAATTVLWTMEEAISIAAGATTTVRGTYNNPTGGAKINGTDFVDPPVSGTDYMANASEDGTGADRTSSLTLVAKFGSAEVEFTLTNTSGSTIYVGGGTAGAFLQVRGKGVYIEDTARRVTIDQTSIDTHGEKVLTIESRYMDLNNHVGSNMSYGEKIINKWKDPLTSADRLYFAANKNVKNMVHFLFMEPRRAATITETMSGLTLTTTVWYMQGYEAEILDGKIVMWNASFKRD